MPDSHIPLVKQWYLDFKNRDIDRLLSIFADDAVVNYGAGSTEGFVPYSGRFAGAKAIREHYDSRLSGKESFEHVRPFCGILKDICEFGRWVVVSGTIADRNDDGTPGFRGRFLQIWTFDPKSHQVTLTDVYYDRNETADGLTGFVSIAPFSVDA